MEIIRGGSPGQFSFYLKTLVEAAQLVGDNNTVVAYNVHNTIFWLDKW